MQSLTWLFYFPDSERMENKAMYLHTFSERENGSIFEESFDGRNLSKLNLCEDGKCGGSFPEQGSSGTLCPWEKGHHSHTLGA